MDWDWLTDWLDAAFAWLVELLLWVPQKLYALFLDGIATVFEAIPAPAWASNISFAGIHNSIAYFAEPFHIELGLTVLVGALGTRFLIRRLPIVG